jgi:putative transcriptional regulator
MAEKGPAVGSKTSGSYFNNQFLVAMPSLLDSNFNHTVTLLCEHNEQGALGLIINRPTDLKLTDMLEHMKLGHAALAGASHIVYWGGPVQQERGFVVHAGPGKWESIGRGEGPEKFFVALGYAGWAAGQLEHEILENSWLNTPVNRPILFDTPASSRWQAATRLLGVDVTQLAGDAGHA